MQTTPRIVPISAVDQLPQMLALQREKATDADLGRVLDPDVDAYRKMEAAGVLISLGAFDKGELVGFSVSMLCPRHLHYAGLVFGQNDVIFVKDEYRESQLLTMLVRETELLCKARGARMMFWHAKPDTGFGELLQRLMYGVQDLVFTKSVEGRDNKVSPHAWRVQP